MHCITLVKERKEGKRLLQGHVLGHVFTLSRSYESCLACQHFISKLLIGHLPRECNNGKGMLSSVEQALGREEIQTPLKTPVWEATFGPVIIFM